MKDERRLVTRAKRDPEAFLELYDHYHPKVYAYILSRVRHKESTEDIVQQTFVKALDKIDKFKYKKSATFGSWIFRIARNEMIDQGKKNSKLIMSDSDEINLIKSDTQDVEKEIDIDQKLNTVLEALDKLDTIERDIVTLKYFSELTYKEISAITGKKPNTLAVTLRRALNKIRLDLNV